MTSILDTSTNHNGTTTPTLDPPSKKQDFSVRTLREFARRFVALNREVRE